jgi:choline dehydrogenase-like flavoprotein
MSGRIITGADIDRDSSIDCDVVIVGSGSGGGAAAARLAEGGLDVVVLEEGGHYGSEKYSRRVTDTIRRLYRDGGISIIYGKPSIVFQEGRCVGGSTVMNGGMSWHTPESVMNVWKTDHGIPYMNPKDMEPYFQYVDQSINVDWQHPDSLSHGDLIFRDSAESLGMPVTANRRSQKNCRGSNVCILGCPDDRKQAVHITYIPRAIQAGARIYTDCKVTQILTDLSSVKGVTAEIIDRETRRKKYALTVRAKMVFLAGGAIQTPSLLKRNRLANKTARVGKNFLCHPNVKVVGIYDRDIYQWKGVHQGCQVHHFLSEGFTLAPGGVPPGVIAFSLPQFGGNNLRVMEQYNQMLVTGAVVQDSTSGSVRNLPGDIIFPWYKIDRVQEQRIRRSTALMAQIHFNAGAKKVLLPFTCLPELNSMDEVKKISTAIIKPRDMEIFTVHAMGTCAMGSNPKRHVVKPNGETWDVKNLFIGDASILPTCTKLNPQVTIQALATKISDEILERKRSFL